MRSDQGHRTAWTRVLIGVETHAVVRGQREHRFGARADQRLNDLDVRRRERLEVERKGDSGAVPGVRAGRASGGRGSHALASATIGDNLSLAENPTQTVSLLAAVRTGWNRQGRRLRSMLPTLSKIGQSAWSAYPS